MVVRELVTLLGFDIEDKKLEEFDKLVGETTDRLLYMGTAVVAASAAIFALVKTSANGADEIKKIALAAGATTAELQKIGYAALFSGASLEEVGVGLKFLNKNAQEALKGGEVRKEFQKLGIDLKGANGQVKTSTELFVELSESLKNVDPGKRASTAIALLGRSGGGLAEMLGLGATELRRLMNEAEQFGGVMSDDQLERLGAFNDNVDKTLSLFKFLKNQIVLGILPAVESVVLMFTEWLIVNRDIIKENLVEWLTGLTRVLKVIWAVVLGVVGAFNKIVNVFGLGKRAAALFFGLMALIFSSATIAGIYALIGAVAALGSAFLIAWLKATAPVAAIIAGIALIVLAVEDLYTYLTDGGESYTGDIVEAFKSMWKKLTEMADQEGVGLGRFLGTLVAKGFWDAFWEQVPGLGRMIGKGLLALPGIKFMSQTGQMPGMIGTDWRNPTIPQSQVAAAGGSSRDNYVEIQNTINIPPGLDPLTTLDRVENGVNTSLQRDLRVTARATAPITR